MPGHRLFGVRPQASAAWSQLGAVLDDMRDQGARPPCVGTADEWYDGDQVDAAEACSWCPARVACLAFAVANRETSGVWWRSGLRRGRPRGREAERVTGHEHDGPELLAADPGTTRRPRSRRACVHCEATPAGCASVHWLRGRWCCERCTGDHDHDDEQP